MAQEATYDAFVLRFFHNVIRQPIYAYGPDTVEDLRRRFLEAHGNIRQLLVDIAVTAALASGGPVRGTDSADSPIEPPTTPKYNHGASIRLRRL